MNSSGTRLLLRSLLAGSVVSSVITALSWVAKIGPWFPPIWPGWFLTIAVQAAAIMVVHGKNDLPDWLALTLITIGNAAFYTWIFVRRTNRVASQK